jgi:hypothetical protein
MKGWKVAGNGSGSRKCLQRNNDKFYEEILKGYGVPE